MDRSALHLLLFFPMTTVDDAMARSDTGLVMSEMERDHCTVLESVDDKGIENRLVWAKCNVVIACIGTVCVCVCV